MSFRRLRTIGSTALMISVLLVFAATALAQDQVGNNSSTHITSGQKMKIKGVVIRRDSDTFVVRDAAGADTTVRLTAQTTVKTNGGFLRSGTNYAQTSILRGLNIEIEGRGNESGELVADKARFNESDMRVARAV